jgi:hypothetical protein
LWPLTWNTESPALSMGIKLVTSDMKHWITSPVYGNQTYDLWHETLNHQPCLWESNLWPLTWNTESPALSEPTKGNMWRFECMANARPIQNELKVVSIHNQPAILVLISLGLKHQFIWHNEGLGQTPLILQALFLSFCLFSVADEINTAISSLSVGLVNKFQWPNPMAVHPCLWAPNE